MNKKQIYYIDTSIGELYYDDENLDKILYGTEAKGPSSTEINIKSKKIMNDIRSAFDNKNIPELLKQIENLINCEDFNQIDGMQTQDEEVYDNKISDEMYIEIFTYLKELIPTYPNPILKYNTKDFKNVLGEIWTDILSRKNKTFLKETFGNILYRWYEHYKEFKKARDVLNILIEIEQDKKDKIEEAIYMNNFAYEYLLEKKWEKAAPDFKKAAELFLESKTNLFEYYNSRVNYLTCKIEAGEIDNIDSIEIEIFEIKTKLNLKANYKSHKPLYLLAKLEEKQGNYEKAISYIEQAIEITEGSGTKYTDEDREYLDKLKRKL